MKTIIASIIIAAAILSHATPAEDRNWATRVTCELQTAGAQSLPTLTFQQGATPLLSLDQYRNGRAVDALTNGTVDAVFQFGPTATSQYYVAVTNYAVSGNGYLVQLPTIGTNTTAGGWWYTAYYMRDGKRYWTGNGRLEIIETTSTADGLTWQEIVCSGAESDPKALPLAYTALTNAATAQATANAALTAEADPIAYPVAINALARLKQLEQYGDASIVPSPDNWFVFSGGEITGFNYVAGRELVVIPYEHNGIPVTSIGGVGFFRCGHRHGQTCYFSNSTKNSNHD